MRLLGCAFMGGRRPLGWCVHDRTALPAGPLLPVPPRQVAGCAVHEALKRHPSLKEKHPQVHCHETAILARLD